MNYNKKKNKFNNQKQDQKNQKVIILKIKNYSKNNNKIIIRLKINYKILIRFKNYNNN